MGISIRNRSIRLGRIMLPLLMLSACPTKADAHEGPPYPIIVDKPIGPCVVSVWADPDVGIGTFFIILESPGDGPIPEGVKVEIAVQPVSGRLPEVRHPAIREALRGRVQFKVEVPFGAKELWRVRVRLQSDRGGGEATTEVEVTPPGLGSWDLLLYLFPFILIGLLWLKGFLRERNRKKTPTA